MSNTFPFPFDAVVGQDDAKLALRLAAVDPRIGGVLLRGEKGSAKTTLARGFAALLGDVPFVELPLGATEDRVLGTLDVRAALTGGGLRFQPGLLAAADGGVVYVDEINLLADHLVDVLLDVAVSGVNVIEREAMSHRHPARFVLVGSMNPEEGELRPQLLDRFGLCVEVRAPTDVAARVESVRRRLGFDATGRVPDAGDTASIPLVSRPAAIPDAVLEAASRLAVEVGAEGLRADLVLCRAAAALAGFERRAEATVDDVRRVAPLALAHRSRRRPFDPPVVPAEDLARSLQDVLGDPPPEGAGDDSPGRAPGPAPLPLGPPRRPPVPPPAAGAGERGRGVRDAPATDTGAVSVLATARALGARRAVEPGAPVAPSDLRSTVRVAATPRTIVVCVDLSGSMGAPERAAAASGTVLGLLTGAYERRDRVALVGFHGEGAEVLVAPTSSVEVARHRLAALATGGETPLAAGISTGLGLARTAARDGGDALLVILTDGRATGSSGAVDDAVAAAADVRRHGVAAMVLDCERGGARLGLAARLAEAMAARYVPVDDLDPINLAATIRAR